MKNDDQYFLGVYCIHNSTAAIFKNGHLIAAVSEERFTGLKNQEGIPLQAVAYCLEQAGITSNNLTKIGISHKVHPMISSKDLKPVDGSFILHIFKMILKLRSLWNYLIFYFPLFYGVTDFFYSCMIHISILMRDSSFRALVSRSIDVPPHKIISLDHHLTHAAAYHVSPFTDREAIVLTLDGQGDDYSGAIYRFSPNGHTVIARMPRSSSLGWFYGLVTQYLGMKMHEHEYKLMGLAPYSKFSSIKPVFETIRSRFYLGGPTGLEIRSKFRTPDTLLFIEKVLGVVRFDVLAGAAQMTLEDVVIDWVKAICSNINCGNIILTGGVFMNIKLNSLIAELPQVSQVWAMPSASDESTAIGAAAYLASCHGHHVAQFDSPYLGPEYSDLNILDVLKLADTKTIKFTQLVNIEKDVATKLSQGHVVARFKGRMEFGARALGNRSIIAPPDNPDIIKEINEQVKNRDFWMPFAPSILAERVADYMVGASSDSYKYMMMGCDSTDTARRDLRAALHPYDMTMRPQIVTQEINPDYHKLIKYYQEITGIGGLLNTSFNLHGFPIVMSPDDAMRAFNNSGLRFLALGNYMVEKSIL